MPTYVPFEETPYSRLHVREHYLGYCSEELSKYLPFRPGLTVLDYDCGNGGVLGYLLPRTGQAWGMTAGTTHGMMSALSAVAPTLRTRIAIAHLACLPLADASLDAVILHDLELDTPAPCKAMLNEVARILRPDGHLLWLLERRRGRDQAVVRLDSLVFDLQTTEPLNYLTVPAAIWLDRIPALRTSMFGKAIMKLVTFIDGMLARTPKFQRYSHHLIVVAQRR